MKFMNLSNPWIPVSTRFSTSGRKRPSGWSAAGRLVGVVTAVLSLMVGVTTVAPLSTARAAVAEPVSVMAMPAPSIAPPTSIPPTSTTRPTLARSASEVVGAESMALAERPFPGRPAVEPQVPVSEFIETVTSVEEPVEAGELVVTALAVVAPFRAVASDQALVVEPVPSDPFDCHARAAALPLTDSAGAFDRSLVAQMTHGVFECVASTGGMNDMAPTTDGWDGGTIWGFDNLSQQVAAESVVVGYCESIGFSDDAITGNNPWGYGGVFQMGDREMNLFGFPGASKFEPVDNAYSAATYFLSMNQRGFGWGGWGPWAVVNTGFNDEINNRVKVPVLPRFVSTDPDFRGRRGVELPAWAVDPWSFEVPEFAGCPTTGRAWPAATPIA